MQDPNLEIAALLLDLSEVYRPAPKFWGYKNAARSRGSDGSDTIAMLAKGCMTRGYQCMCATDHSYGLPIAGGMKMDELRAQHAEINKLNKKFGGTFRVFKGVEANILQDGSLDMDPSELPEFDLVVASPHSSLRKTFDQAGCVFALDSDAHAANQHWMADDAIAHARLAGIPAARIINCWPVTDILNWGRTFPRLAASKATAR